MGKNAFSAYALGDMLYTCSDGEAIDAWGVVEVDHATVVEARKYEHLTHGAHNLNQFSNTKGLDMLDAMSV